MHGENKKASTQIERQKKFYTCIMSGVKIRMINNYLIRGRGKYALALNHLTRVKFY